MGEIKYLLKIQSSLIQFRVVQKLRIQSIVYMNNQLVLNGYLLNNICINLQEREIGNGFHRRRFHLH